MPPKDARFSLAILLCFCKFGLTWIFTFKTFV